MDEASFSPEQIRRAVLQKLEGLRRDGITHWHRIAPATPVVQNTSPSESSAGLISQRPPVPAVNTNVRGISSATVPVSKSFAQEIVLTKIAPSGDLESLEVAKKTTLAAALALVPSAPFQPLNLPLAARVAGLAALAERVKACTRCQELASTRTQTVFGVGNPEAKILFIGEAPGADEDAQGEPFVGRSGQLMNDIIKACRMRREDIYICNILRCRPPGNRLPEPTEAANCREYLDGQIAHVNPEYIVCWGACAAQNLLTTKESIGKLRGRFWTFGRAKVICTYHPSYLLRNPPAKKDVWEDMKLLFRDMGIDLTAKA